MTHIRNILIVGTIIFLVVITSASAARLPNYCVNKSVTALNMQYFETSVFISLPEDNTSGYQWKVVNASGLSFLNNSQSEYGGREGVVWTPGIRSFFVSHAEIGNQTFSAALMKGNDTAPGEDGMYNLSLHVS